MAKINIPFLVSKQRGARLHWYWQPSATLIAAGWKSLPLGGDANAALAAAQKRNAEVDAWRIGGHGPQAIKPNVHRGTVSALIVEYKRARFEGEDGNPPLAKSTQHVYSSALAIIETWAGDTPLDKITPGRVQVLKKALLKPRAAAPGVEGGIEGDRRLHRAHSTLRVLRTLMQFAVRSDKIATNPAIDPGLGAPEPRDQVWSAAARNAIGAAALVPQTMNSIDYPADLSVALATLLGFTIGQREGDLLKLSIKHYVELSPGVIGDPAVYAQLSRLHGDRRVMGISFRQSKGRRWVSVPVVGNTRREIEAAIERSLAAGCTTILIDERTKRPWLGKAGETRFQRRFADVRATAVEIARDAGDDTLADEMEGLQFRDLRRTNVVYLGELGLPDHLIAAITGHKLDQTKKILETYMPRTTAMAARGIALSHAQGVPEEQENVG